MKDVHAQDLEHCENPTLPNHIILLAVQIYQTGNRENWGLEHIIHECH